MPRKKPTSDLATLYSRFLDRQPEEWRARFADVSRRRARILGRLRKQGVVTVADLLERFPCLSPALKSFAIEVICLLEMRRAIPVLLDLMLDQSSGRDVRFACVNALYLLEAGKRVSQVFVEIGNRELGSTRPDRHWLEAVILGLGSSDDPAAVELLVRIFESVDLPGWVRGDAADKLGCVGSICDRRTSLFRRCRDTALRGLADASIDVQFWSMYLIGQLCSGWTSRQSSKPDDFESALPQLRQFEANDNRLAPGYWWPMSAEAEDVIACIAGGWPEQDAAERWLGNTARGEWNRD